MSVDTLKKTTTETPEDLVLQELLVVSETETIKVR